MKIGCKCSQMNGKLGCECQMGIIKPCRKRDLDPKRPKSQQKVCLYTKRKPRRLLGRHPSNKSAVRQERVIEMRKRGA
jgi:hypothetical protein